MCNNSYLNPINIINYKFLRLLNTNTNRNTKILLYKNYKDITSEVINNILINQKVFITQTDLDNIIKIPRVKFNLPLDKSNIRAQTSFINLVGTPKTRSRRPGVYIFTHKKTGSKYVGSSNSLSRRMEQYFTPDAFNVINKYDSGLLLPLMRQEGFSAFELEIIVMPEKYYNKYYLFLEQYYLLHSSFNLNVQRVVNFRINQGKKIFIYNTNYTILYYASESLNEIKENLGIHHNTYVKNTTDNKLYLNYFRISTDFVKHANKSKLSIPELSNLISEKRKLFLKDNFVKLLRKPVIVKNVITGDILTISSIKEVVIYFKSKNIIVDRNKISKCIITGDEYKGYYFLTLK